METVTLGRTGLTVCKNGFGALPIQRIPQNDAVYLLQKAFYNGITYFDTARSYTDSEEKVGHAFRHVRPKLFIATKTPSVTVEGFWSDLHTSLRLLQTDYIDVLQFHNPAFCPLPGDGTGLYEAMLEAKAQGKIRFIGITNHRLRVAEEAVKSGLYDLLQFPFSYLASDIEENLVRAAAEADVGFVAMKALSGGLITHSAAAYAYLAQYENVLPIWGVQRESELDEFLAYNTCPPTLNAEMQAVIEADRAMLAGEFCRGCGYCMPCPEEIEINNCARMSLMLRRAPSRDFLTPAWQEKMKKIENCRHCGACEKRCPYNLRTAELLQRNYEDYKTFLK